MLASAKMMGGFREEIAGLCKSIALALTPNSRFAPDSTGHKMSDEELIKLSLSAAPDPLALKLHKNSPQTLAALIDIGVEQKLLRMDADERCTVLAERMAANDNTPRRRRKSAA